MLYVVSYDLQKPSRNYDELFKALKSYGTYSHCLESTWLISSDKTASVISNHLRTKIDEDDSLLVIRATKNYAGWLPKKIWNWLDRR